MSPHFLNVDLDLLTQKKPAQIIRDFGKDAVVLASDKTAEGYFTRFEMSVSPDTAEKAMSGYQHLLGRLSPSAVIEWKNAKRKEFNFGYETSPEPPRCEIVIKQDWLRFVVKNDATLAVTVYPKEKDNT
jgi:hypothetical protein